MCFSSYYHFSFSFHRYEPDRKRVDERTKIKKNIHKCRDLKKKLLLLEELHPSSKMLNEKLKK